MSLKIGIVGLPNVGKSTLFNALTHKKVDISNYPFCTIEPNVGIVPVPDERLEQLSKLVPQAEVIPAVIEAVDVAGLVKGAHQGEGLGNQFLSHLFPMDALMFLIRCFKDENVTSLAEDPEEQYQVLQEELLKKDEELAKRSQVTKVSTIVETLVKLAEKPVLTVCNIREGGANNDFRRCHFRMDAKLELELSEITEQERNELGLQPKLPELIRAAYRTLDLITFYTIKGGQELRAWPIKRGTLAPQAAGIVHSDFQEKFIRADVINWQKLVEAESWTRAKEWGWIRTEGKEYMVQDGDVIEFKI